MKDRCESGEVDVLSTWEDLGVDLTPHSNERRVAWLSLLLVINAFTLASQGFSALFVPTTCIRCNLPDDTSSDTQWFDLEYQIRAFKGLSQASLPIYPCKEAVSSSQWFDPFESEQDSE